MYVYLKTESGLYSVGFIRPTGELEKESTHRTQDDAVSRVSRLNGGKRSKDLIAALKTVIRTYENKILD